MGLEKTLPSGEELTLILQQCLAILFPGYFVYPSSGRTLDAKSLKTPIEETLASLQTQCQRALDLCGESNTDPAIRAAQVTQFFELGLREARTQMISDLQAAYEGDPAAKSHEEILLSYPGFLATSIYRMAHLLEEQSVPLLPRMMTEYAHARTGIDIHPGAKIGAHFFIDHGTGVVIGETAVIGDHVKIYQGVTLGALSIPVGDLKELKRHPKKRHPTLEDHVVVYAGATILGGQTTIGKGSVIGGNTWVTASVPAGTKVMTSGGGQKISSLL